MENLSLVIIVVLIIAVLLAFSKVSKYSSHTRKIHKNNTYSYAIKEYPMTRTEAEFFVKLQNVVSERYYIFPQMHLSGFLNHKVANGQPWQYAFSHINSKSVDYLLCDKTTLRPTYAIELDDYTHDKADRRERDAEVERILEEANLPLVRFRNKNVSEADIIKALMNSRKLI